MAKELPFFQFEPAEYLTKDISFCSLSAQGLFINLCSYYWQRNCVLTRDQFLRRLNFEEEFNELIQEGIIDITGDNIIIKFLDKQRVEAIERSERGRINGKKGGRPKNPNKTQTKPKQKVNQNPNKTQTKAIRKDKIREEENKEENKVFSFKDSLLELGVKKQVAEDFMKVRKTKKATNTQTAFNRLKSEIDKINLSANEVIQMCVENDWKGFKAEWVEGQRNGTVKKLRKLAPNVHTL